VHAYASLVSLDAAQTLETMGLRTGTIYLPLAPRSSTLCSVAGWVFLVVVVVRNGSSFCQQQEFERHTMHATVRVHVANDAALGVVQLAKALHKKDEDNNKTRDGEIRVQKMAGGGQIGKSAKALWTFCAHP